jgi:SulP family sulfate permease
VIPKLIRRARAFLPSLADYRGVKRSWRGDLIAGVTVGIVALPLALAFGVSSGAGAESGLITAIVAGVVAAVFGGSNLQVSGPTGAMVVVLGPIIAVHGVGILPIVCLMAGLVLVAVGTARIGRVVSLIPWPVIEGFTLGIAVIIFLQQVPAAIGSPAGHSTNAAMAAVESFTGADPVSAAWTLGIVAAVAFIMILAPRLHPRLPGSIIAVIVVTAIAVLLRAPVETIGTLPATLPSPQFPTLDPTTVASLAVPAVMVAALAGIESLLSVRVASSMTDAGAYDPERELVGQGLASIASGLFGGMPATGAIARTAVNVRAGARTRVAAIVHSLVLLLVVYAASTIVAAIPLAVLSGVLMVTTTRMLPWSTVVTVMRSSRSDAVVFVVTAFVTVSLDLIYAVLIGILVAAFFALRTLARSGGVQREPLPGAAQAGDDQIAVFRLDGALFFATADRVLRQIGEIERVQVVILRLSQLQLLDSTGAHVVAELVIDLERRGMTVLIKGIRPDHLPLTTRVGVLAALRHPNHLFDTLVDAAAHARTHVVKSAAHAPHEESQGTAPTQENIRVINPRTGELLRELTLNPAIDYQPQKPQNALPKESEI